MQTFAAPPARSCCPPVAGGAIAQFQGAEPDPCGPRARARGPRRPEPIGSVNNSTGGVDPGVPDLIGKGRLGGCGGGTAKSLLHNPNYGYTSAENRLTMPARGAYKN